MAEQITNDGLDAVVKIIGGIVVVPDPFNYIAIGSDTGSVLPLAATNTALGAEFTDGTDADRAQVTPTLESGHILQLQKTWTFTTTRNVSEIGIFNSPSAGTMLGRSIFSAYVCQNGDSFQITAKVTVSTTT